MICLKEFIAWCNNNVGFLSLVLSTLTLLVSIIAVFVSIHTARLPYKKKIIVTTGGILSEAGLGLHITATNVGNRDLQIKTIGFLIEKQVYINKNTLFDSQVILSQGETTSQYYSLDEFKKVIREMKINPSIMIKAFVEDTEGKRYKKKLDKVKKIIK